MYKVKYIDILRRASENIFWLQCKRGSSKWASPHHKRFATFLRNFYIFKQLLGNFEIWASVRRTQRTLFSDALILRIYEPVDAIHYEYMYWCIYVYTNNFLCTISHRQRFIGKLTKPRNLIDYLVMIFNTSSRCVSLLYKPDQNICCLCRFVWLIKSAPLLMS